MIESIRWVRGRLRILDQSRLPVETVYVELNDLEQLIEAIKSLRIRGAPALGVAAAYGLVLGLAGKIFTRREELLSQFDGIAQVLLSSRPTAVNIAWALRRLRRVAESTEELEQASERLLAEAQRIQAEDVENNRRLGAFGAELIPSGATVLTHCNTGSLATAGYGTALGVIRAAVAQGNQVQVLATETRPLLQGARLTTWELVQEGIPVTLITDSMAGHLMARSRVTCVLVGADRIAANGDTANKIGTYTLAVLAKENRLPFYVAAPFSTIDFFTSSGWHIPIEERRPEEVLQFGGVQVAPEGVQVANPAFDITPARYIAGIITDEGVATRPYRANLRRIREGRFEGSPESVRSSDG